MLTWSLIQFAETDLELIYRVSGSATPGQDYLIEGLNEQVGRVTIAQGRTGASIRVAIVDDGVDEARETLVLTLYASSGYMVGDSRNTPQRLSTMMSQSSR